jgi:hypothetical protein
MVARSHQTTVSKRLVEDLKWANDAIRNGDRSTRQIIRKDARYAAQHEEADETFPPVFATVTETWRSKEKHNLAGIDNQRAGADQVSLEREEVHDEVREARLQLTANLVTGGGTEHEGGSIR